MNELMEFFAPDDHDGQYHLPQGKVSMIDNLPITVRVDTDGDFENWTRGLHPAEVEVVKEDGEPKTEYLYGEFTYIFEITSLPQMIDDGVSIPMECKVGDQVYLKFHPSKRGNFLVCCKYEEHE